MPAPQQEIEAGRSRLNRATVRSAEGQSGHDDGSDPRQAHL
jgi:hypothetical protein